MYSSSEDEGGRGPRRDFSKTRELAGKGRPTSDSESSDVGGGRSLRDRMRYVFSSLPKMSDAC